MVGEDRERAVEPGEPPPGRGQRILQLAVGHDHASVRRDDGRRAQHAGRHVRLGHHRDGPYRLRNGDGQGRGGHRLRAEPAGRAAGRGEPDLNPESHVVPGVRVRHLDLGHVNRGAEVPGGTLIRRNVTPPSAPWPPGRPVPADAGHEIRRRGQQDRRIELVEGPVRDRPRRQGVLPVPGGLVRSGRRRVDAVDGRGVPLDGRHSADAHRVVVGRVEAGQLGRIEQVGIVDGETARIPERRHRAHRTRASRTDHRRREPGSPARPARAAGSSGSGRHREERRVRTARARRR